MQAAGYQRIKVEADLRQQDGVQTVLGDGFGSVTVTERIRRPVDVAFPEKLPPVIPVR